MNRDQRNIWTVVDRAGDKESKKSAVEESAHFSIEIVTDRSVSIMESVVEHLRDSGFTNQQVADLLSRSRKTVSTVYKRAKQKREASNEQ